MSNSLSTKVALKRITAEHAGVPFELTVADVQSLLNEAGITPADWRHDRYHLTRRDRTGSFTRENSHFIPASQNYRERVATSASREASRRNIVACNRARSVNERRRVGKLGGVASARNRAAGGPCNTLTEAELRARFELVKHVDWRAWGAVTQASNILNLTPQYTSRLCRRWRKLGLLPARA